MCYNVLKKRKGVSLPAIASVRLNEDEISAIKRAFFETFGEGKVILFGSRTDMSQRGGDIDLYLIPENRENIWEKRVRFLVKLDLYIGEQKVDVVIATQQNRLIEKEALEKGVVL